MFLGLQQDMRAIIQHSFDLVYYMRGAISYREAMHMSIPERELMASYLKNKLEEAAKMPTPIF